MSTILLSSDGAAPSALTTIIYLAIIVLIIVAEWKLFEKAGEPGWKAIVPVYNVYTFFKIITGNGWKFLFLFIPFFNFIYEIIIMFKLAKAFGKGTGFGFGLLFLSVIFLPILAFGDAQYVGPQ